MKELIRVNEKVTISDMRDMGRHDGSPAGQWSGWGGGIG